MIKRIASGLLRVASAVVGGAFWAVIYLLSSILNFIPVLFDAVAETSVWMIKLFLALILGTLIFAAGFKFLSDSVDAQRVEGTLPPFKASEAMRTDEQVYNPMIRLVKFGRFRCSATVVSDHYAITASHCVISGLGLMDTGPIVIKSNKNEDTGIVASAVGMMKSQDVALLRGDFRKFQKVELETDPRGWLAHMGPYAACGFPGGDRPICTQFMPQGSNGFLVYGTGVLYKGMSGGPVLSRNNRLIGVNSRAYNQGVAIGPLVGFLAGMNVEIQE